MTQSKSKTFQTKNIFPALTPVQDSTSRSKNSNARSEGAGAEKSSDFFATRHMQIIRNQPYIYIYIYYRYINHIIYIYTYIYIYNTYDFKIIHFNHNPGFLFTPGWFRIGKLLLPIVLLHLWNWYLPTAQHGHGNCWLKTPLGMIAQAQSTVRLNDHKPLRYPLVI